MGFLNKLFLKKAIPENIETDVVANADCLEQAEQISSVVSAGIEQDDFSLMNKQLNVFAAREEKQHYIFEHPNIELYVIGIIICALFSLIYFYFILIGLGTIFLSAKHLIYGIIGISTSLVLLSINFILIFKLVALIRYKHRFDNYINILRFKSFELIDDLAAYSNQNNKVLIEDLKRCVKQKLIPQGHFTKENLVFMISDCVCQVKMLAKGPQKC